MQYIVTNIEEVRLSKMVEAETPEQAVTITQGYDFTPFATHEVRRTRIEVAPATTEEVPEKDQMN